jgi:hypothetical protein
VNISSCGRWVVRTGDSAIYTNVHGATLFEASTSQVSSGIGIQSGSPFPKTPAPCLTAFTPTRDTRIGSQAGGVFPEDRGPCLDTNSSVHLAAGPRMFFWFNVDGVEVRVVHLMQWQQNNHNFIIMNEYCCHLAQVVRQCASVSTSPIHGCSQCRGQGRGQGGQGRGQGRGQAYGWRPGARARARARSRASARYGRCRGRSGYLTGCQARDGCRGCRNGCPGLCI